ncbi:unnamed protein product [Cladocopium goreaui]|uniref:Methyltransferase FkbM domain-containing protein n=1 Tax=Cladocopium goreaui TaxID=2562237 RepID=A0A9P1BSI3_9DINO|nr:unnamed protein product [Cladocopium goreaui]
MESICGSQKFVFEQVGGRCRLVCEDDFRSVVETEEHRSLRKARREAAEKERRSSKRDEQRKKVAEFLRLKKFGSDVNAPKTSCCGFFSTYPLQEAARDKHWKMVLLLMQCGADAKKKDSFGKTVLDLVDSPPVRDHILQLHLRRVTEQEPRTKPEKLIR